MRRCGATEEARQEGTFCQHSGDRVRAAPSVYGLRFTFTWYPTGCMTERQFPNGVTVNRTFDAAGREVVRDAAGHAVR